MNMKNGLIFSVLFNLGLIALIFYVKSNATSQAQEFVKSFQEKANSQLKQAAEIKANNDVLWEMVMEIMESDGSLASVTRIAKTKRLPNRENEEAFLAISATTVDGLKARHIGWEKYSVTATFDKKDQLVKLNVDDLLGREPAEQ